MARRPRSSCFSRRFDSHGAVAGRFRLYRQICRCNRQWCNRRTDRPRNTSWYVSLKHFEIYGTNAVAGAEKLYHFVRTPTWVTPPRIMSIKMLGSPAKDMLSQIEIDNQENFSASQIERFKSDPQFYKTFVKAIERDINGAFPMVS
jgi:hypothetical protein